jgi:hypothetical protein
VVNFKIGGWMLYHAIGNPHLFRNSLGLASETTSLNFSVTYEEPGPQVVMILNLWALKDLFGTGSSVSCKTLLNIVCFLFPFSLVRLKCAGKVIHFQTPLFIKSSFVFHVFVSLIWILDY